MTKNVKVLKYKENFEAIKALREKFENGLKGIVDELNERYYFKKFTFKSESWESTIIGGLTEYLLGTRYVLANFRVTEEGITGTVSDNKSMRLVREYVHSFSHIHDVKLLDPLGYDISREHLPYLKLHPD